MSLLTRNADPAEKVDFHRQVWVRCDLRRPETVLSACHTHSHVHHMRCFWFRPPVFAVHQKEAELNPFDFFSCEDKVGGDKW